METAIIYTFPYMWICVLAKWKRMLFYIHMQKCTCMYIYTSSQHICIYIAIKTPFAWLRSYKDVRKALSLSGIIVDTTQLYVICVYLWVGFLLSFIEAPLFVVCLVPHQMLLEMHTLQFSWFATKTYMPYILKYTPIFWNIYIWMMDSSFYFF